MRFIKITGYAVFFVFSLLLVSCTVKEFELAPLDIEILKHHFPFNEYVNAKKIVFKNENNNDLVLNMERHNATTVTFNSEGLPYKSDHETFILTPNNTSDIVDELCPETISFRLNLTSSYVNDDPIKEIRIYQIMHNSRKFILTLDSLGTTSNGPAERMTILTASHEEVLTSTNNWIDEIEPGFYYNKTHGLVGFIDENDELWVFDRFE